MSTSFTHNEKYEFRNEDNQLIEDHPVVTPDFLAILSQNGIPKLLTYAQYVCSERTGEERTPYHTRIAPPLC
jgi:hypothetical protein